MNVLSLFDGISCGMVALERAGIPVDHYATAPSGRFNKWLYGVSGLQTGEKFREFWVDDGFGVSIHKNNFVSFRIITTYKNDTSNYSLEYLMKNLSADEMIEYLKDNGLNVCPIVR